MAKFDAAYNERDPIYEYVFRNKMDPYIQYARDWWAHWDKEVFYETGSYPAEGAPPGMFIRFSRTLAHSPIHNIQAFPYVSVPFLQLHHIPGGVRKLVDELCHDGITIDEFQLVEKKYLHGTERNGQFVCIIPLELMGREDVRGRYIWLNNSDIISLAGGCLDTSLKERFKYYAKSISVNSAKGGTE